MKILIYNELRKLFKRGKTWVVLAMFIALLALITYSSYRNYKSYQEYQKPEFQKNIAQEQLKSWEENKKSIENDTAMTKEDKNISLNDINNQIQILQNQIKQFDEAISKGEENVDWKSSIKDQIQTSKSNIEQMETTLKTNNGTEQSSYLVQEINTSKLQLQKLQYLYDNNIKPEKDVTFTAYSVILNIVEAVGSIFLMIGIMVFVCDMVSGEYTPPTMKFLLVQPVTRRKILFSKFVTITIIALILIIGVELIFFLGVGLVGGFGDGNYPIVSGAKYIIDKTITLSDGTHPLKMIENSSHIISRNLYLLEVLGIQALFILAASAVGFMLSTIFKSSMISMAVSIVGSIALYITSMLVSFMRKITHLLFISYQDPRSIVTGETAYNLKNIHLNGSTAVVVLISTAIICYILSHIFFTKKDILI